MGRLSALFALLLLLPGCFPRDADVTDRGLSRPEVSIEFPPTAAPGSTQTATIDITNPGPGDMNGLTVTFARLGDPRLPRPIVDAAQTKENPAVASVDPEPVSISMDGVVYVFEGLAEGESTTITFDLVVPETEGLAANSVTVSDKDELDRARGGRLETEVQR